MSSAFTKEQDDNNPREDLPDRPISSHRNLVTPEGLIQIETHLVRLHKELESAATKMTPMRSLSLKENYAIGQQDAQAPKLFQPLRTIAKYALATRLS